MKRTRRTSVTAADGEFIRANMGTMTDRQIADAIGLYTDTVAKARTRMKLYRRKTNGMTERQIELAAATPEKPKGYTAEYVTWCREHATPAELRLILGMHAERKRRAA